ncbi:MAG: hypothetical protein CM1200mP13_16050 [Candidatus Pelagibacterales bacterium]|nr:MAG: hypothetical protein CM1200mP13_16050 [Pelagibacterales bacterium]
MIQINTGKEPQKSGIMPDDADNFFKYCKEDLKLNITGLMCIPRMRKILLFILLTLKKKKI